jgi:hypothetical protein
LYRTNQLEPLGDIDLTGIDWIICGGESGPRARPMHPDWVRSIRDQCQAAGVSFFFKQWGEWATLKQIGAYFAEGVFKNRKHTGKYDLKFYNDVTLPNIQSIGSLPSYYKVGKKTAGDLLDGKQYHEFPEAQA